VKTAEYSAMGSDILKPRVQFLLLLAVCFFSFFVHISSDELDIMEARNFITAREMVTDGSWLLPTMNNELRIAKPPLPTWITAVAVMMGGDADNMLAMRIPAALTATVMVFIVFGFVGAMTQKESLLPFIIATLFALNAFVIAVGRRNSWDVYAHCFMMIVLWSLWRGWEEKNHSLSPFVIAGIASGLSFMSKGPVDFYSVLVPFSVTYIAVFGVKPIWEKRSGLLIGLIIAIVISGAWPLYVYLNAPKISVAVANEEISAWKYDCVQPVYYYLNFPFFAGAWVVMFAAYFIRPFAKIRVQPIFDYVFPLIWLLSTLVLLSVIPSKKERYLMPVCVPMSLMIGFLIHSVAQRYKLFQQTRGDRILINIHAGLIAIMSLAMPVAYFFLNKDVSTPVVAWSGILIAYAIMAWMTYQAGKRKRIYSLFFLTQIFMCLSLTILWPGISTKDHKNKDFSSIRELRHDHEVSGIEFYSPSPLNIKAIWDIGQKVLPWPYDNRSLPKGGKFILFFNDRKTAAKFAADYRENITFTVLGEYKWNPNMRDRSIVAALIES